MPAAFMFHERKFQSAHNELLGMATKLVHSLGKSTHPLVTGEEKRIINDVAANLPLSPRLRCWNHLLQDVKRWLRSHGATSKDLSVYITNLWELFHQPTMAEYNGQLESMIHKWSTPFLENYSNEISPDITSVARWAINSYGVYDPYSGVTNNQAESFNWNQACRKLQLCPETAPQEWHEALVDCMALVLHHLQSYYLVEIA